MANILILAALSEEGDVLFADQGARAADRFGTRRLTAHGHDLTIAICGLGKVNAALCAGMLGDGADMWLMSGTCGSLGAAPGAWWISDAIQHDYGVRQPGNFRRYRAGDWPIGDAGDLPFSAMPDPGLGLPHARIVSGDSFVACPEAAAELTQGLRATLVDMEVAAMAQAALRLGKPWAAIKAVTDEANEGSGDDFHANLLRAAATAAHQVERLVSLL